VAQLLAGLLLAGTPGAGEGPLPGRTLRAAAEAAVGLRLLLAGKPGVGPCSWSRHAS